MMSLILRTNFERSNIQLTHEERVRMFYWCRDQAYDCILMAKMTKNRMGTHLQRMYFEEAMQYLFVARSVFPMTQDKETVSIEDILNGKVPKETRDA